MPFWEKVGLKQKLDICVNGVGAVTPKWQTGHGYDVIGGDHVKHVSDKLDLTGTTDLFDIIVAKPNELQIDYDYKELPTQFHEVLNMLAQAYCRPKRQSVSYVISRSVSNNLHVTITLPCAISDIERIAWQAIFGSDRTREALSLMSVIRNIKNPTLFIDPKNKVIVDRGTVVMKEQEPKGRMFRDGN